MLFASCDISEEEHHALLRNNDDDIYETWVFLALVEVAHVFPHLSVETKTSFASHVTDRAYLHTIFVFVALA